jgi:hypothetical protein
VASNFFNGLTGVRTSDEILVSESSVSGHPDVKSESEIIERWIWTAGGHSLQLPKPR